MSAEVEMVIEMVMETVMVMAMAIVAINGNGKC